MKKLLLSLSLCALLCGCGEKVAENKKEEEKEQKEVKEEKVNEDVLTCTLEEEGYATGKYIVTFADGKAVKLTQTMDFLDEEEAKVICEDYKQDALKVECNGKNVTVTSDNLEEFSDEEYTKENLKKELEEMGFKCE